MRDIFQYFDLLEKTLNSSLAVSAEVEFDRRDHTHGLIEGVLYFADGSRLEFTERILWEQNAADNRTDLEASVG